MRATTITLLFNAGVATQHIRARTGHRTAEGLQSYVGQQTAGQRRVEADILGAALRGEDALAPRGGQGQQTHTVTGSVDYQQTVQAQMGGMSADALQGHFANCTFTIHVNHYHNQ